MTKRRLYIRGVVSFRNHLHSFLSGDHSLENHWKMMENARSAIGKIDEILASNEMEFIELPAPTRNAYEDIVDIINFRQVEDQASNERRDSDQLTLSMFQEGNEAESAYLKEQNNANEPDSCRSSSPLKPTIDHLPEQTDSSVGTSVENMIDEHARLQNIANESALRMNLGMDIRAEYYRYTRIRVTGRNRRDRYLIRVSHLLKEAPDHVLDAAISLLIAKFQNRSHEKYDRIFKSYVRRETILKRVEEHRTSNARKILRGSRGDHHDLTKEYSIVNHDYFNDEMGNLTLTWGKKSRRTLGHYDHAMQTIVVSKLLDSKDVPRDVIQYILYHEMLHSRIRTHYQNGRRVVHSKEFRDREKQFVGYRDAKDSIRKLLKRTGQ